MRAKLAKIEADMRGEGGDGDSTCNGGGDGDGTEDGRHQLPRPMTAMGRLQHQRGGGGGGGGGYKRRGGGGGGYSGSSMGETIMTRRDVQQHVMRSFATLRKRMSLEEEAPHAKMRESYRKHKETQARKALSAEREAEKQRLLQLDAEHRAAVLIQAAARRHGTKSSIHHRRRNKHHQAALKRQRRKLAAKRKKAVLSHNKDMRALVRIQQLVRIFLARCAVRRQKNFGAEKARQSAAVRARVAAIQAKIEAEEKRKRDEEEAKRRAVEEAARRKKEAEDAESARLARIEAENKQKRTELAAQKNKALMVRIGLSKKHHPDDMHRFL